MLDKFQLAGDGEGKDAMKDRKSILKERRSSQREQFLSLVMIVLDGEEASG